MSQALTTTVSQLVLSGKSVSNSPLGKYGLPKAPPTPLDMSLASGFPMFHPSMMYTGFNPFQPYFNPFPYIFPPGDDFASSSSSSSGSDSSSSSPEATSTELVVAKTPKPTASQLNQRFQFVDSPEGIDVAVVDILSEQSEKDKRLTYDLRYNHRSNARMPGSGDRFGSRELAFPLSSANLPEVTIVCTKLPWSIKIKAHPRNPKGVTVGEVLVGISESMDKEISDSELWMMDDEDKTRTMESQRKNVEAGCGIHAIRKDEKDSALRRVDWLGSKTLFAGLTRPHTAEQRALVKERVHSTHFAQTFVLELDDQ